MGNRMDDFEQFLYFNYPDDWRRFTAADVTEDVKTAIMSSRASSYRIWKEIPAWIKNNYHDRIPPEVLNGNIPVKEFIAQETQANKEEEKQTNALINFSVMALAVGYAADTVVTLTNNRKARQDLLAQYGDKLPEDMLEQWLAIRQSDFDAIKKDWQERHPERYLLHLFQKLSHAQRRLDKGVVLDENETKDRIRGLEQEIQEFVGRLSSKDIKLDMVDYLRGRPQQMALKHLVPSVLDKFTDVMQKQGIKIEPVQNQKMSERIMSGVDSLTKSLKKAFNQREQVESLMRKQAQYIAPDFVRQCKSERKTSKNVSLVHAKTDKARALSD